MWVGLPRGGVKDNKEENDALAWKVWPLQLEQETSAELAKNCSPIHRPAQQDHPLTELLRPGKVSVFDDCFHTTPRE